MMPEGFHRDRSAALLAGLQKYETEVATLPGIAQSEARRTFADQMISSLRRIEYVRGFRTRPVSPDRMDPHSARFDPLKGAYHLGRKGELDEAVWMTFVATHFGKHIDDGWKLASNVMGSFGQGPVWTAEYYGLHSADFATMLAAHQNDLRSPAISGRFSNHRQYQSKSAAVIGNVFATFHQWQFAAGGFDALIRQIHRQVGQEPTTVFKQLYRSMKPVYGFGRLGNFDLLTMLDKLGLAPIEADSVHLIGATGPLAGAKLLLLGGTNAAGSVKDIQTSIDRLDAYLNVGKQVLEDSLCNWQKSPTKYLYFRG